MTTAEAPALLDDWRLWARPAQRLPEPLPETWMLMAGRGYGKTRSGAEAIRELVVEREIKAFLFVATNPRDARDLMIEEESCGKLEARPGREVLVQPPENDVMAVDHRLFFVYARLRADDELQLQGAVEGIEQGKPVLAITWPLLAPHGIKGLRDLAQHELVEVDHLLGDRR